MVFVWAELKLTLLHAIDPTLRDVAWWTPILRKNKTIKTLAPLVDVSAFTTRPNRGVKSVSSCDRFFLPQPFIIELALCVCFVAVCGRSLFRFVRAFRVMPFYDWPAALRFVTQQK